MAWSSSWSVLVSLVIISLTTSSIFVGASCLQEPRLCCDGKNNTCRREGARITNNDSFTCFCDSVCFQLGDCCVDYGSTCQAVDCVLDDEWTDWSPCDVTCGTGFRRRSRKVIREALNGGKDCDPVTERVPCHATTLCQQPKEEERKETEEKYLDDENIAAESAKVIPAAADLTWNRTHSLDTRRPATLPRIKDNSAWSNEDNSNSQDNNGHRKTTTHDYKQYFGVYELTDVRNACFLSSQWSRQMTNGMTICADCRALAMRRRLAGHCKGHGVPLRETRFVAVTIPGCHGRWRLKGPHDQGMCHESGNHLDLLFV